MSPIFKKKEFLWKNMGAGTGQKSGREIDLPLTSQTWQRLFDRTVNRRSKMLVALKAIGLKRAAKEVNGYLIKANLPKNF